ncbi:XRE family transcriptional regulator [Mesorhizobium sp. M0019]|uniref:helix-turn-helix domain-containing protein n=1 Tax=Mesorhizobium sp. M0019 TaxID=2956845 RepID=UPI00333C0FAE
MTSIMRSADIAKELSDANLGERVRALRAAANLTIKDVAGGSGLSASTISKIENNLLSPTYESIIRLARGLDVDISDLFYDGKKELPSGRRSITKSGQGIQFRTKNYDYEMLCTDLIGKKMIPIRTRVKAREVRDFGQLIRHNGEEVLIVLSGSIVLQTEFYAPIILEAGDSAYFDSTMGHVCLVNGDADAEIFWVCTGADVIDLVESAASNTAEGAIAE